MNLQETPTEDCFIRPPQIQAFGSNMQQNPLRRQVVQVNRFQIMVVDGQTGSPIDWAL